MSTPPASIAALASACAANVPTAPSTFESDTRAFEASWQALLFATARSDKRFDFDREGRPGALDAVRHALPAMERELLEVIMEDMACELAANREAIYRIALAMRGA